MTPSFQRKVIYLALIAALLVPLSLISRPATTSVAGDAGSAGGKLAQLREEYKLGQAQLGQIDPTSSAVRYVSLGMHGLAVCILWNKVDEYQKQEDWISLSAVLKQLTVLQPYYVKVWTYQSWNVSYNVASKWDDYRDKYFWVMRGFKLLARGMEFNELEPQFPYDLGWTIGHKIGQADEKTRLPHSVCQRRRVSSPAVGAMGERARQLALRQAVPRVCQELVDRRGAVLRSIGAELFNEQPAISQSQYAQDDRARRNVRREGAPCVGAGERRVEEVRRTRVPDRSRLFDSLQRFADRCNSGSTRPSKQVSMR